MTKLSIISLIYFYTVKSYSKSSKWSRVFWFRYLNSVCICIAFFIFNSFYEIILFLFCIGAKTRQWLVSHYCFCIVCTELNNRFILRLSHQGHCPAYTSCITRISLWSASRSRHPLLFKSSPDHCRQYRRAKHPQSRQIQELTLLTLLVSSLSSSLAFVSSGFPFLNRSTTVFPRTV